MKKISIVVGTRPEIIKCYSLIRQLESVNADYYIIFSGQHYTPEMGTDFFTELELPKPKYFLDSLDSAGQIQSMIRQIKKIFAADRPDIVLVQGDTNTTLAAAISAKSLSLCLGHIEAGLRSYNLEMAEERNRIIVDHLSDFLFCPTQLEKQVLINEGIIDEKIHVVGNTVADAVLSFGRSGGDARDAKKDYMLLTLHRQENVDDKARFKKIISQIDAIYSEFGLPILFPIHPRTQKMMTNFGIKFGKGVQLMKPCRYSDFLDYMKKSRIVITDSGGIQEEASILKVPCLTIRDETERPQTIDMKSNVLVRADDNIIPFVEQAMAVMPEWNHPFGDGNTAVRILGILGGPR